jgi:hypothetical protein
MRVDVHPADFDHPRLLLALERVLRSAERREAVTYDELAAPRRRAGVRSAALPGSPAQQA